MTRVRIGTAKVRTTALDKERKIERREEADHTLDKVRTSAEHVAMLHVGLDVKRTEGYQSVSLHVGVTIPWSPDDVAGGLAKAHDYADQFLAENYPYVEDTLAALQEQR